MSPRQCLVASLFLAYVALCVSARRTLAQADATVADAEAATDDYPVGPCTFKAGRVVVGGWPAQLCLWRLCISVATEQEGDGRAAGVGASPFALQWSNLACN